LRADHFVIKGGIPFHGESAGIDVVTGEVMPPPSLDVLEPSENVLGTVVN
jgi:hypothetical protein